MVGAPHRKINRATAVRDAGGAPLANARGGADFGHFAQSNACPDGSLPGIFFQLFLSRIFCHGAEKNIPERRGAACAITAR